MLASCNKLLILACRCYDWGAPQEWWVSGPWLGEK